jgi:hypothetical protein
VAGLMKMWRSSRLALSLMNSGPKPPITYRGQKCFDPRLVKQRGKIAPSNRTDMTPFFIQCQGEQKKCISIRAIVVDGSAFGQSHPDK